MKKIVLGICMILFCHVSTAFSAERMFKPSNLNIYTSYGHHVGGDQYIPSSGVAFGWTMQPKFKIHKNVKLVVEWSYTRFNIDEDEAGILADWGWTNFTFYNQGHIDGEKAGFTVKWDWKTRTSQHAGIVLLEIGPDAKGKFRPYVNLGTGAHLFIRKGWLTEDWYQKWPDGEVDKAKYRRHSDKKPTGVIMTVLGGAGTDVMINENIGISAAFQYNSVVKDHKKYRWDAWWKLQGGFVFYY